MRKTACSALSGWAFMVLVGCCAVLAGCGGPEGGSDAGLALRLSPETPGQTAPAAMLQVTWLDKFTVTGQTTDKTTSRIDLDYPDRHGKTAALGRLAVVYGEPDQTLDEKFGALTDEAKVSVALKDTYKVAGEPVDFQTADGSSGQLRRYEYLDGSQVKQIHVFAVIDLRKQDAVYVRFQLLSTAANWDKLRDPCMDFLKGLKRKAP